MATAAYLSGSEVEPPSWEVRVAEFDIDLAAEPAQLTDVDRDRLMWRQAIGAA